MNKDDRNGERGQGAVGKERVVVQLSLPLVDALLGLEEDYFGLCVHAGQAVLETMMEEQRTQLCGAKWSRIENRQVARGGSTRSEVTLGGRRVPIRRPRVRGVEGGEMSLPAFQWANRRDPLDRATMRAIAGGVSTRHYAGVLDPLPADVEERATAKSSVSRRFVALSEAKLSEWLHQSLDDVELAAILIDGIHFAEHCVLIALGVTREGRKRILGLHEGSTENATVARAILANLVERGLDPASPILFVIDGSKALRRAIRDVWGECGVVQRCQVHKMRNVLEHLPEQARPRVRAEIAKAYADPSHATAKSRLERLARSLEREHPGAAASLREGLEETLTLQRLRIQGALFRTLRSTNPIENLNDSISTHTANVKRWRGGYMILRWIASALHHAQPRFRAVRGFSELPKLASALAREVANKTEIGEKNAA